MKLSIFKTSTLLLSSIAVIGLSGCGSEGTPTALGATGAEQNETVENIKPVSVPVVNPSSVIRGEAFQLDGSASSDEDGQITSYTWVLTDGQGEVEIGDTSIIDVNRSVSFNAAPGTYTFGLLVFDDQNAADYETTQLIVNPIVVPDPEIDHLEIQENYCGDGDCPIITNTTQTLPLVEDVNYDPVTPGAYYPTVWAVYKDPERGKVYVNTEAAWTSSRLWPAYVFGVQGSFVFGRDLTLGDPATITAYYNGHKASFQVKVELEAGQPTLESIYLKTNDGTVVTTLTIPVNEKIWVTAYGEYSDGTTADINSNVYFISDAPEVAAVFEVRDSNVRARSVGSAIITVGWQGKTTTLNVNVVE